MSHLRRSAFLWLLGAVLVSGVPASAAGVTHSGGADVILIADDTTASPGAAAPTPSEAAPTTPPAPSAVEPAQPATPPTGRTLPELSAWSMFLNADILVKGVMLGLGFASLVTWTILIGKTVELAVAVRRLRGGLTRLAAVRTLNEAYLTLGRQTDIVAVLVREAVAETRLSDDIADDAGLRERVASRFSEALKVESRAVRRGMGLLATIGSTAPFVGLFGTVWGIMNSFIGISKAQTTNLAVVAPGIAEALLATAIGLVAAIPAVIVYNHFTRATKGYLDGAAGAAGAVGRILSRDLDRAHHSPMALAAE